MKGRQPDFIVSSLVGAPGPRRPREIGVGFWNDAKDRVVVLLDAVPLTGRLVLATRRVDPRSQREPGSEG